MLLNIYLGTTAVSWATALISSAVINNKLKKEGYKTVKEKKSFSKKVTTLISTTIKLSIPIFNIVNTILIFYHRDKLYGYMKDSLLKEGKIYKPDEQKLNNNCESHISSKEKDNTYTANVQKTISEKTYNEMTAEEKLDYLQQMKERLDYLQQEKERLDYLQQNLQQRKKTLQFYNRILEQLNDENSKRRK